MQKLVIQVKTQKSTNNSMSILGLIEENMELPSIHLAVQSYTSQLLQTLEKGAQKSHLGRKNMGWFLAD